MDIGLNSEYPAGDLSNFSPFLFVFEGVECASMEGLLQSFKFEDPEVQIEVCDLFGSLAKKRGQERNHIWQSKQKLWWQGTTYCRHENAYQYLLNRAFNALACNTFFQKALRATGSEHLVHTIGKSDKSETVLTEVEFCSRLVAIRTTL